MASPSGASSGCTTSPGNSASEMDDHMQQHVSEQRKRKRMLSNRESARRSRMRKQQHLDELIAQVGQLKKENNQIITNMGITTQMCLNMEADNAILRAQVAELSNRLQSLNEIIEYINSINCLQQLFDDDEVVDTQINGCEFMNPRNSLSLNQPIMNTVDMLMY